MSLDQVSQERVQSPSLDMLKIQLKRLCTTSSELVLFWVGIGTKWLPAISSNPNGSRQHKSKTVSLLSSSGHWCWVSCPGNSGFAFSILNNWSKLYYSFLFGGLFFTWLRFTTLFTLSTAHKEKIMKILASCLSGRGTIKEHEVQLWQPPDSSTATVLIFTTNHIFRSDTFHKPSSWNAWRLKTINFTEELLKRGHILCFKKSLFDGYTPSPTP